MPCVATTFMTQPAPPTRGRLPDFIVIGTQKGGTTALHHFLARHPQVAMSRMKELDFFIDPDRLAPAPSGRRRQAWHEGIDWYRNWFRTDKQACGEASPNYTISPSLASIVATRMAAVVPDARLIYLVRQPFERILSHYAMMMKRPGAKSVSFEHFVRSGDSVATSCYGSLLRVYLDHFPRERILILESADLRARRRESLATVFRHLGVDQTFWCRWFERDVHVGARLPHVSAQGTRVRDSTPLRWLRRSLPDSISFHAERLCLAPFAIAPPTTDLPAPLRADLFSRLREEMDLLRRLSGQPLPTLELPTP